MVATPRPAAIAPPHAWSTARREPRQHETRTTARRRRRRGVPAGSGRSLVRSICAVEIALDVRVERVGRRRGHRHSQSSPRPSSRTSATRPPPWRDAGSARDEHQRQQPGLRQLSVRAYRLADRRSPRLGPRSQGCPVAGRSAPRPDTRSEGCRRTRCALRGSEAGVREALGTAPGGTAPWSTTRVSAITSELCATYRCDRAADRFPRPSRKAAFRTRHPSIRNRCCEPPQLAASAVPRCIRGDAPAVYRREGTGLGPVVSDRVHVRPDARARESAALHAGWSVCASSSSRDPVVVQPRCRCCPALFWRPSSRWPQLPSLRELLDSRLLPHGSPGSAPRVCATASTWYALGRALARRRPVDRLPDRALDAGLPALRNGSHSRGDASAPLGALGHRDGGLGDVARTDTRPA